MRMHKQVAVVLSVMMFSHAAWAQAISDERLDDLIRGCWRARTEQNNAAAREGKVVSAADDQRAADQALEGVDLDSLTPTQLWQLAANGMLGGARREKGLALLAKGREAGGSGGAFAAWGYVSVLSDLASSSDTTVSEALRAALTHPGLKAALREPPAGRIASALTMIASNRAHAAAACIDDITAMMALRPGLVVMAYLDDAVSPIGRLKVDPMKLEAFRTATLDASRACRKRLDDPEEIATYSRGMGNRGKVEQETLIIIRSNAAGKLQQMERQLENAFAGRVVGRKAGEVSLHWVSGAHEGESDLAALRGRVVVLVEWPYLWAPQEAQDAAKFMAALRERFASKPVEVVAIFSTVPGTMLVGGERINPGTREQQLAGAREQALKAGVTNPVAAVNQAQHEAAVGRLESEVVVVDASGIVRAASLIQGELEHTVRAIEEALKAEPARSPAESH
jgi:hypothetical protein